MNVWVWVWIICSLFGLIILVKDKLLAVSYEEVDFELYSSTSTVDTWMDIMMTHWMISGLLQFRAAYCPTSYRVLEYRRLSCLVPCCYPRGWVQTVWMNSKRKYTQFSKEGSKLQAQNPESCLHEKRPIYHIYNDLFGILTNRIVNRPRNFIIPKKSNNVQPSTDRDAPWRKGNDSPEQNLQVYRQHALKVCHMN